MRIDANDWKWLVDAIIHVSHQIRRVEQKVDILLQRSQVDLSQEDAAVLAATKTVQEALGKISTPEQNKKG